MQSVTVEGYLAADASVLTAQGSGKKRAGFRLVETARYRNSDGEPGERNTGFNCVCFNAATAENYIGPYGRKGSRVVVQGHVENDTWTGRDGTVHYDLRLVVEEIRIKTRRQEAPGPDIADARECGGGVSADDEIPF